MAGSKKNGTFAETMEELLRAQGAVCVICESPDRADIEAAIKRGAPKSMIATALQRLGVIDPNITTDTAAKRVSAHVRNHMAEDGERNE